MEDHNDGGHKMVVVLFWVPLKSHGEKGSLKTLHTQKGMVRKLSDFGCQ